MSQPRQGSLLMQLRRNRADLHVTFLNANTYVRAASRRILFPDVQPLNATPSALRDMHTGAQSLSHPWSYASRNISGGVPALAARIIVRHSSLLVVSPGFLIACVSAQLLDSALSEE